MPTATRNARGLATARRVERAAVALASASGLDALTVDGICAAAGISQRTFFHHFPTKEDALLGLEVPRIDEARARAYLSDAGVGVLVGALDLIELPPSQAEDPEFTAQHLRLLAASPALQRRQGERFEPLLREVRELVRLKLAARAAAAGEEVTPAQLDERAGLVTALGAGLMNHLAQRAADGAGAGVASVEDQLAVLRPVWGSLL